MTFGPMQVLVVGFAGGEFRGEIAAELERLREHDVARLVDLLLVTKLDDGTIAAVRADDLTPDESSELSALAASLVGLGAGEEMGAGDAEVSGEVWYIADAIPPGTTAAVAVIEHRWAIPLREAVQRAGGIALADEWLHPEDLLFADAMEAAADVGAAEAAAEEAETEAAETRRTPAP